MIVVGLVLTAFSVWDGLEPAFGGGPSLARMTWQAGLVLASVGSVGLAVLTASYRLPRDRTWAEAVLGFLCLLLSLGSVALVNASAASKRFAERWRNIGRGE